jgi:hypothetical protein
LQFVATDVATTTSRLPGVAGHLASNHCFLWIFCLLSGRRGQVQPVSSHSRSNTRAGPEAERLGGLEISRKVEFNWLLDRDVRRLCGAQNFVDMLGGTPE